jgi:DNA primase
MDRPAPVALLTVPLGGQQIEMHPIEFDAGGLPLLRVRIREGRRFTVFDIDPGTAVAWGEALQAWGRLPAGSPQ